MEKGAWRGWFPLRPGVTKLPEMPGQRRVLWPGARGEDALVLRKRIPSPPPDLFHGVGEWPSGAPPESPGTPSGFRVIDNRARCRGCPRWRGNHGVGHLRGAGPAIGLRHAGDLLLDDGERRVPASPSPGADPRPAGRDEHVQHFLVGANDKHLPEPFRLSGTITVCSIRQSIPQKQAGHHGSASLTGHPGNHGR